ncbi:hypothetical protein HPP92_029173 [Vanilla planifolia]|uniref:Uncharacterized protein n=1 Tax=Vanilla planifolia TaxID=51239 RepID=A0A835P4V4_VANPL|nr:hypothetical protein HPP92_029173 [Vanilla planifolia]KAG0445786.1 hypothetical protein HPP92_029160 [Vanilla planifolia]
MPLFTKARNRIGSKTREDSSVPTVHKIQLAPELTGMQPISTLKTKLSSIIFTMPASFAEEIRSHRTTIPIPRFIIMEQRVTEFSEASETHYLPSNRADQRLNLILRPRKMDPLASSRAFHAISLIPGFRRFASSLPPGSIIYRPGLCGVIYD